VRILGILTRGGGTPVLPTSHRIWTNPTIGPWDKSPRGYATVNVRRL